MTGGQRIDIEPFTAHGGRLDMARAAFPVAGEWIDLSTGIAPWSYPADVEPGMLARLPDSADLAALEAAAATVFGAKPANVVAVPGSDLALRLVAQLIDGRIAVMRPGYSGHVAMWGVAAPIPVGADDLEAAASIDAIVLARPNNPDGMVVARSRLEALAAALAARGGHLIVDEAFADATPHASVAGTEWPGLIVLRSFGKFYGLAGLRLGFVVAPPPIVAALRRLLGDWPVSGLAIAIGTAAYADRDWQEAQRTRLDGGVAQLDGALATASLAIVGGTQFFRLIETPARDALFAHLAAAGILTRPFADAPDRLRIGIPRDQTSRARLERALNSWRCR